MRARHRETAVTRSRSLGGMHGLGPVLAAGSSLSRCTRACRQSSGRWTKGIVRRERGGGSTPYSATGNPRSRLACRREASASPAQSRRPRSVASPSPRGKIGSDQHEVRAPLGPVQEVLHRIVGRRRRTRGHQGKAPHGPRGPGDPATSRSWPRRHQPPGSRRESAVAHRVPRSCGVAGTCLRNSTGASWRNRAARSVRHNPTRRRSPGHPAPGSRRPRRRRCGESPLQGRHAPW